MLRLIRRIFRYQQQQNIEQKKKKHFQTTI